MLIAFSVGNYRSFRDRQTLSMEAAEQSSQPMALDERNVVAVHPALRVLTSAVIVGANASGKSNLVHAINVMRWHVLNSLTPTRFDRPLHSEPFRLSTATEGQPSEFEMAFLVDGALYRYGFAMGRRAVVREWLFRMGTRRESRMFMRTGSTITVNPRTFREGRGLEPRTRTDVLFLSVVAQFDGPLAQQLTAWFAALNVVTGITGWSDAVQACAACGESPYRSIIEACIQRLDTGIERIELKRAPGRVDASRQTHALHGARQARTHGEATMRMRVATYHQRFDGAGRPAGSVAFDLDHHESGGTQRLFVLAPAIVRALKEGGVLVIDDFDARIHPNLAVELVRWFNDPATNPRHAQLIVTAHHPQLLDESLFRRDQVWFVERTRQGASHVFSLLEYRIDDTIGRNDASFKQDYLLGRYGAIPFIGDVRELLGAIHGATGTAAEERLHPGTTRMRRS